MSRQALVVGAGLIGSLTSKALAADFGTVLAVDPYGSPGYFARLTGDSGAALELRSVDPDLLDGRAWDAVVLAAGDPAKGPKDLGAEAELTSILTRSLAGRRTRLVHVSSLAVYGLQGSPLCERAPTSPRTPYGLRKLRQEATIRDEPNLDYCILRSCGVYGPIRGSAGSSSARFLDSALRQALVHGKVTLKGAPGWGDEYLYASDLAAALAQAASADLNGDRTRIINIGSGERSTAEDVAAAIRASVPDAEVEILLEPSDREPLPILDCTLATKLLDFHPKHNLVSGLAECRAWIGGAR